MLFGNCTGTLFSLSPGWPCFTFFFFALKNFFYMFCLLFVYLFLIDSFPLLFASCRFGKSLF